MAPSNITKHGKDDKPPMVISYLRFSTAEQVKGDSTRRQLDLSEKYAKQRGWNIDKNMTDKGVSAFRGSNAANGALSKLLDLVKDQRVPRGSVLLVESLDRLSRNEISEALELFLGLIRSGIRIVTLGDGYEYRQGQLELSNLMYSLMVMSRSHEESATKSRRIGEAWKAKRSQIGTRPLTAMVPAWLELRDGKIVVDQHKARQVKRIFAMAIEGHGMMQIVKALNDEKVSIGWRRDVWIRSYVAKVLHNRAVIGEFQPHRISHERGRREREPVGEPIKNYYPAVVAEQDFYAAQAALKNRRVGHSGPNKKYVNLFKGLVFDVQDKCPLQIRKKETRAYASAEALDGRSNRGAIGFPVAAFEAAFLARMSETASLDFQDTRISELNHKLRGVSGKLATVEKRIEGINAALADSDDQRSAPAALIPALTKLDNERQQLAAEHEDIQQQLAAVNVGSPKEAAERIAEMMAGSLTGRMRPAARLELQQAIAQLVERIDCDISRDGPRTRCAVSVVLRNRTTINYTAVVKNRYGSEVMVDNGDGDKTYIEVEINGQEPGGVSMETEDRVRELWQDAMRPVEIAKQCDIAVTQVYRIAGTLKRLKEFKPANRWDQRKQARD